MIDGSRTARPPAPTTTSCRSATTADAGPNPGGSSTSCRSSTSPSSVRISSTALVPASFARSRTNRSSPSTATARTSGPSTRASGSTSVVGWGRTTMARRDLLDGTTTTVPPGVAATRPVASPARGTGTGSPTDPPQQSRCTSVRQSDRPITSTQMPFDPSAHRAIGRRSSSATAAAVTPSRWRSCASWRSTPVGVASQSCPPLIASATGTVPRTSVAELGDAELVQAPDRPVTRPHPQQATTRVDGDQRATVGRAGTRHQPGSKRTRGADRSHRPPVGRRAPPRATGPRLRSGRRDPAADSCPRHLHVEVGLADDGDLVPVEVDRCLAPWLADPTDRARLDREHAVAHGCERGHLLARDRTAEGPRGDVVAPHPRR